MFEHNEDIPREILNKIPKKRDKKGYEIIRNDIDVDESKADVSLEELLSNIDQKSSNHSGNKDSKNSKDKKQHNRFKQKKKP